MLSINMTITLFDDDYDAVYIQRPVPEPTVRPSLKFRSASRIHNKCDMLDFGTLTKLHSREDLTTPTTDLV